MKRARPQGSISITTRRRRWTRRLALALATALFGSLVGCGTGPGASSGDVTPPSLQLSGVRDGDVRAEAEIAFDVLASDPSAVASVIWSSDHAAQGACAHATGGAYACGPVPLPAGATTITVRARDTSATRGRSPSRSSATRRRRT